MATKVMSTPTVQFEVSDLPELLQAALVTAATQQGKTPEDTAERIQGGDCSVCEVVRYRFAEGLAAYLGAVDASVKAVYIYEPEYATSYDDVALDGQSRSHGINLIVWAARKSAALQSLASYAADELHSQVVKLSCPKANSLCWALDLQIVDDEQVLKRTGYGALIESLYVRPMELWRR